MLHEAIVGDDGIQPGGKFGFPVKAPEFSENVDKSVLKSLSRFVGIPAYLVRETVHGAFIPPDKFGESRIIALSGDKYEFVVRKGSWRPGSQEYDAA